MPQRAAQQVRLGDELGREGSVRAGQLDRVEAVDHVKRFRYVDAISP
jgi:hypothetical protein